MSGNNTMVRVFSNRNEMDLKAPTGYNGRTVTVRYYQDIVWWIGGFFQYSENKDGGTIS